MRIDVSGAAYKALTVKDEQLQIRVSAEQKAQLGAAARAAGMSVSSWVLSQALSPMQGSFAALCVELARDPARASYTLAAIHDLLARLPTRQLDARHLPEPTALRDPMHRAYVAAMVEHVCHRKRRSAPEWTRDVGALAEPYFASTLVSLRARLLRVSPPPFRRRNLFVDSSVGDRV